MARSSIFAQPITFKEYYQITIDSKVNSYDVDYAAILKEKLYASKYLQKC